MKVEKSTLQEALEIVKPGLTNREILEQANSFAFLTNRVATYNDEISISHPVNLKIKGAVKAEELYGILTKFKKDEIIFSTEKDQIVMKSGRAKAGLKLDPKIQLPIKDEIGKITDWEKIRKPERFCEHLQFAMKACSNDMTQAKLTCVNVMESGVMHGCDGFRLVRTIGTPQPFSFVIPASFVDNIVKINPIEVSLGDSWIHFKNDFGTIISCRLPNLEYLAEDDLNNVLDFNAKHKLEFPKQIETILSRVRVLAKRDFVFDESVSINIKDSKISLTSTAEDTKSWYVEEAKLDYSGKDFEFAITPALFKDILKETKTCHLSKDLRKMKFVSKQWEYVILLRK